MASAAETASWLEVFVCFWKVASALERGDERDLLKAYEAQKDLLQLVLPENSFYIGLI